MGRRERAGVLEGPLRFQRLWAVQSPEECSQAGEQAAGSHPSQGGRGDQGSCQGLSLGTRTWEGGGILPFSLERQNPYGWAAAFGDAKNPTGLAPWAPLGLG